MAKDNNVKIDIDFSAGAVTKRYRNKGNLALTTLKNEIIKDTDPYVPMRDGGLKKSVLSSTGTKKMQIVYRKVYAKFLYYGNLTYSYGGPEWFEKSKKKNLNKWIDIAKKLFK